VGSGPQATTGWRILRLPAKSLPRKVSRANLGRRTLRYPAAVGRVEASPADPVAKALLLISARPSFSCRTKPVLASSPRQGLPRTPGMLWAPPNRVGGSRSAETTVAKGRRRVMNSASFGAARRHHAVLRTVHAGRGVIGPHHRGWCGRFPWLSGDSGSYVWLKQPRRARTLRRDREQRY